MRSTIMYLDQRSLWNLQCVSQSGYILWSESRHSDVLDAWKYFWLHIFVSI
jgi:hypothetical protein